jgi:pimeloyl-ACP methyl ester carboxylesterase
MSLLDRPALAAALLAWAGPALAQPADAPGDLLPAIACTAADRSVDARGFVPIGGIDQWVTVRGSDCRNPAILFVHGGPGNTLSPFSAAIFAGWERDFTIVQWDQRGAGRTFGRNPGSAEEVLTISRMTADGTELAARLAASLGQERLILVGTSWGSALGVHMVRARPDLFHAYVGISQLVGQRANQGASWKKLLAAARSAGDSQTVSAIEALGPPPWANPRNFGIVRRAIRKYEARATDPAPAHWWTPAPPYASPETAAAYEGGEDHSYIQFVGMTGDGMLSRIDLPSLGNGFPIPFHLVQGSEDLLTVPEASRDYFDSIGAPEKSFTLVPSAGHDPNAKMFEAVRALLIARAAGWRATVRGR